MGVDLIKGEDPSGEPRAFKVQGVKSAFSRSTPIPDGFAFESAIVFVGEYPYFSSVIKADRACTVTFDWYSDQAGTTLLGSSVYSYITADGIRLISGSVESDFLQVTISNSSGADMTTFSHRLKLSASPLFNQEAIELSLSDVQTEINDEMATTRATIESVGEELEVSVGLVVSEIDAEALALRSHITSDGALTRTQIDLATTQLVAVNSELDTQTTALGTVNTNLTTINSNLDAEFLAGRTNETTEHGLTRTQILAVQTEVNDEALAIRNHITSDGALTRTQIDLATTQLTAVNAELDAQTALLTTIDADTGSIDTKLTTIDNKITSDGTLTRATIESVGEEIETALAIQHPRIIRHAYDQIGIDAGGRIRVSQFTTLMDGKVVNGHTSLIFESAGTGTFTPGSSKNNMSVTSGQWCVFQTKRFYPYFSGKSQAIEETFDGFAPEANVVKRFGYFSSSEVSPFDTVYDGMWCESDGTTINLRMARAGTSTLNLPITSWSGYANLGEYQNLANWNNFTVCLFDFLCLGGAVMRFWVKTQSGFVLAHVFNYAGTAQDVFMLCPCHPVRYEIRSSTGTGSFRYICSQVATEGSFEEDGIVRAITTGTTAITCATSGTVYPLLALRKQTAFRGVASKISDFNLFVTSQNDQLLYTIQINPVLSAPLSYNNVANSSLQSAVGNGTITVTTEGTIMAAGFLTQNSILPTSLLQNNFLSYMGGTLANVMDEYVLCATPLTGVTNAATFASMAYKEY